jgi:rubrerythrin
MDDDLKKNLKSLARQTEVKVARSILRWKLKREGRPIPVEEQLDQHSEHIVEKANDVLSQGGKRVWDELRQVYRGNTAREEDEE